MTWLLTVQQRCSSERNNTCLLWSYCKPVPSCSAYANQPAVSHATGSHRGAIGRHTAEWRCGLHFHNKAQSLTPVNASFIKCGLKASEKVHGRALVLLIDCILGTRIRGFPVSDRVRNAAWLLGRNAPADSRLLSEKPAGSSGLCGLACFAQDIPLTKKYNTGLLA